MTGSMIVNNLAGLMMLTSLFVISVKAIACHADFTPASRWCWCLFSPLSRVCSSQSNC